MCMPTDRKDAWDESSLGRDAILGHPSLHDIGVGRHFDPVVHGVFEESLSEIGSFRHEFSEQHLG